MLTLKHVTRASSKVHHASNGVRTLAQVASLSPAHHQYSAKLDATKVAPFLLEDLAQGKTEEEIKALPQFTLSRASGFLPRQDPLAKLPKAFDNLDGLLNRMTIRQYDAQGNEAEPGLLAKGHFGDAILDELKPDGVEMKAVEKAITSGDQHLMSALFRDYCFATSAYLLEPTDQSYRKTGFYAPGRDRLPAQLAVPLKKLADALGHQPFMEYASSYALQNYAFKDGNKTDGEAGRYSFDNMRLIRAFEDAQGSERGFILVHIVMVSFSGRALSAAEDALAAAASRDVPAFEAGLERLLKSYRQINVAMETMWSRSKPSDYLKFRSFIFGTAPKEPASPMFPNGVIYEGLHDNEQPRFYRGESGANDSLVPLLDNLLEITASLPNNDLTRTLRDFRTYRPKTQREYLESLEVRSTSAAVKEFALSCSGSAKAKALYLLLVDQNREFRNRHWNFAKEYIVRQTSFEYATGGSKMLSYLPHNLGVVLDFLDEAYAAFSPKDDAALFALGEEKLRDQVHEAGQRAAAQHRVLLREVDKMKIDARDKEAAGGQGGSNATAPGMLAMDSSTTTTAATTAKDQINEDRSLKRGMVGCDGVG